MCKGWNPDEGARVQLLRARIWRATQRANMPWMSPERRFHAAKPPTSGTALPTQRECLRMMGCEGKGKALKLCEIAAALVVAGELSLSGAARVDKKTRTNEWVDAHERLGRNR